MTQLYDKLTGRTLRRVDKAIELIEKHLFNFDGNKEVIKWISRSPGFIDFEGHDPISNALVKGGFEHDNRGRVKSYFALTDLNNTIPDFYFWCRIERQRIQEAYQSNRYTKLNRRRHACQI